MTQVVTYVVTPVLTSARTGARCDGKGAGSRISGMLPDQGWERHDATSAA